MAEEQPGDWAMELGPLQQGDIELLEDAIEALLQPRNAIQQDHALHGLQKRVEAAKTMQAQGCTVPPGWKGYALLGTGLYCIDHTPGPPDSELGAELVISIADEADKSGNRQVGEERDTRPDKGPLMPERMAVRIGFLNATALDALESQLRHLRRENFPATDGVSVPDLRASDEPDSKR